MTAPTVDGGPGGITANRDTIEHLARAHHAGAAELTWTLVELTRAVADGSGMEAALLDPNGAVAAALAADAVTGLRTAVTGLGHLAVLLDNAAQGYPWGSSALDAGLLDTLRGLFGSLSALGPLGAPATAFNGGATDPGGRIHGLDPHTVDLLASLGGLAALSSLTPETRDGTGVAVATASGQTPAPRTLGDLLGGLAEVDREGTAGGIDVRVVVGPGGRRAAIVDITGTRSWTPGGRNVADIVTNQRALTGHETAYAQGVLAALRQAGVRPGDDVMLVGHSQGGMVAIDVARQACRTGAFHVTHVVTAGSPIALTVGRLPPSVRVLALENDRDVVPRVDHRANPDRASVTTVTGRAGDGSVGGNHSLDGVYVPLAIDAQHSGSRSVRDFVDSADAFLGGLHVTQHSYRVERH